MSPNYQLQNHYWITMTHCRVLHGNEITHLISSLKKLKKFSLLFKCFYQAVNMTKNPFKSLLPSWKKESLAVHIIAEILLTTSVRGFYYTQEMQRPESFYSIWIAKGVGLQKIQTISVRFGKNVRHIMNPKKVSGFFLTFWDKVSTLKTSWKSATMKLKIILKN